MQDDTAEALAGALSAHGFILQNLMALIIAQYDRPLDACDGMAAEMLRQYALPVTNRGPMDADAKQRITDHGEAHLRRFWELVRGRLESAGK